MNEYGEAGLALLIGAAAAGILRLTARANDNFRHRTWLAVLLGMLLLPILESVTHQLPAAAVEPAPAAPADSPMAQGSEPLTEMAQLVAKIQAEERRLHDYSATITTRHDFPPPKEKQPSGTISFGPSLTRGKIDVQSQTVQGDRLNFVDEEIALLVSGEKTNGQHRTVSDGAKTVSIDQGKIATIHQGRFEPPQMIPPHDWGIFHLQVHFPLSVYLSGTEALKSHPTVGRYPVERGSVFEFNKVQAELVAEEAAAGLDCVKVRVKRWYHTAGEPAIQYLWLAKDRNFHVAQTRLAALRNGKEVASQESRVTRWQECDGGRWFPVEVEVYAIAPGEKSDDRAKPQQRLTVERLAVDPSVPNDSFELPAIPAELPTFEFSADGRLLDSPQHPASAAQDQGVTLETILTRLEAEEGKYDDLEVIAHERYQMLNAGQSLAAGFQLESGKERRSVTAGNRLFYAERRTTQRGDDSTSTEIHRQAHDGRFTRELRVRADGGEDQQPQITAAIWLGGGEDMNLLRPHSLAFAGDGIRNPQSLARFLRSGWFDAHNHYPMVVEYVGDEKLGELHCHKLRCEIPHKGRSAANNYFFLWLARDRNLLAVRHEWHSPAWHPTLPDGLTYLDDLREIRPGVWFPYRTIALAFQKIGPASLAQSCLAMQWRNDVVVDRVTPGPTVDDALFTTIEVPAGTMVGVRDEAGQFIGRFTMSERGNIAIADDQLLELRQKAAVSREQAQERQQALDALIGQQAPELPAETWLNSRPLTWKDLAGKIVVVDFWATWCGPCQNDLERLAQIHKAWREGGVTDRLLLGIHTAATDRQAVAKVAAEKKLDYPIVIDSPPAEGLAAWGDLFGKFAVRQIPLAILVDGSGTIVAHGELEKMLAQAGKLAKPEGEVRPSGAK